MANRFVFPNVQRFDANGNPGAGWKLGFFVPGTNTRKDTYSDEDLTTENTNPVVADASGVWPDIFMSGKYDVRLLDASDVQQQSWNNVKGPIFAAVGGSDAGDVPTNASIGSFIPALTLEGTDAYTGALGRDVSAGETARGDFGSANTTTTPTFNNTDGTGGALTLTTRDGSALWAGALDGVHDLQRAASSWLVLDPNPSQQVDPIAYADTKLPSVAETATDGGTDAYASQTTTSTPASGTTILRVFDSANTTASPTLDGVNLVDVAGNAWAGLIGARVHALFYDGTNYVVLDPVNVDFTIIYPNGGTAASPANVTINTRYVESNPFPGFHVICQAQLQAPSGDWGNSGFFSLNGDGYGTQAWTYSDAATGSEQIIVQTGNQAVISTFAADNLGGHGDLGTDQLSAACRVLVWKVKGITS